MKKPRRLTIFDLEKATGFSRGTISRAFNSGEEISSSTRDAILKKAAEIGYSPHSGARSMKSGKTGRWGLMIPHLRNPFFSELMEAVDHEARKRGNLLLVGLSHYDLRLELDLMQHWSQGETDGIIVCSYSPKQLPEIHGKLQARGFPLVFLYKTPSPNFDVIDIEVDTSLDRAMRHLLDLGHKRIAYLGLERQARWDAATFKAYRRIFEKKLAVYDEKLVCLCSEEPRDWVAAWKYLRNLSDPPTAVVCFNDIVACWLMHAARADGLRIPEDLSILGNDDVMEATRAGLTTVRVNIPQIATEIFDLFDQPKKPAEKGRVRSVESSLVFRDSIASPRKSPLGKTGS